ncbi:unnamed protein product, partial [Mesorhabditis spiculigera]
MGRNALEDSNAANRLYPFRLFLNGGQWFSLTSRIKINLSWNPIYVNYNNQRGVGWMTEVVFKLKRDVSNHLGLKPHF